MTAVHVPPDYPAICRRLTTRLREARRAQHLTQEQLAERAGVHRNTIQNLECETYVRAPAFRIDVVLAVAHALGLQPGDLFAQP